MKYTEKMQLLLKGVKMEEIKALEEQEAQELKEEQEQQKISNDEMEKVKNEALEAATALVKELEAKLEAKDSELEKANKDLESLNNKRTLEEQPTESKASDVFKELFKPTKEV
jgi:acetylglutamate kinase